MEEIELKETPGKEEKEEKEEEEEEEEEQKEFENYKILQKLKQKNLFLVSKIDNKFFREN